MTLSSPPEPIGYMAELGVERTLWTPGQSRLELTLTEDHLNKGGVAHGGIHMILLDSALGSALVASGCNARVIAMSQHKGIDDALALRGLLVRLACNQMVRFTRMG